jgi:hypothetical protein
MTDSESIAKEKDWYVPAILISGLHMVTRLPKDVFEDSDSQLRRQPQEWRFCVVGCNRWDCAIAINNSMQ